MNGSTVTLTGLFLEGLLSFFSPCVLPLVPLYIGYLTAGREEGEERKPLRTFLLTVCFVLGICTVFLIAALGSSALRLFFQHHTLQFQLAGGFLLLLFGMMMLGVIRVPFLEKDYRIPGVKPGKSSPLQAYLLGFFFSFAWSPCIGPLLASAMVASASASSAAQGSLYILAYGLGFVIPFLITGLFTDTILAWLKKHAGIVKWTGIIGGAVVACMGIYMLFQANHSILALQRQAAAEPVVVSNEPAADNTASAESETAAIAEDDGASDSQKYDFALKDKDGTEHRLTDYNGKPVLLNFFGTWCGYCNEELPSLQRIHDEGRVQVVLIAAPGFNGEGDIDYVEQYMKEAGYSLPILYDSDFQVSGMYGISSYPTTFIIKSDGNFLGYMPGYMPDEMLDEVIAEVTQ